MQPEWGGGACCSSQGPQASGREWRLRFPQKHGFLKQTCRINMHKSFFGSASHFANIGSWKAGSPASNPPLLKAQSRQLFTDLQRSLYKTTEITINTSNPKLGYHQLYLLQAWCNHNEVVERAAVLRDLKLLVEWKVSLPQKHRFLKQTCGIHFANIGSWNACSPASNPLLLKSESGQFFTDLQRSLYKTTEITINTCNPKLGYHKFYLLQAWCNHNKVVERAAALRDLKLLVEWKVRFRQKHGFLKQTCRINLLSAVYQL